ncbi:MAG: uroporphyrinogen-III C-methyltransferase [Leptolyngbya sp.]|nr:MAG: uroporphyrinogen-III C-methyltransferase [Leptolyngbya sp.]
MAEQAGKVYLVGSGPGDADYLTTQAQTLLATAEVLVYDALVDSELLDLVPEDCLKLNVGKRGGQPSMAQPEINRLLVQHCDRGRQVVRLKSGDPFVFGRAQAEIEALVAARCDYEVVPGLSSALVAPLLAGIPLTDPELSSSFTVCTAHNPDALNWVSLAKLETLVILMGGRTLPEIVRRLRGHGKSPKTPIAVIRWAGRAEQQIWEGTLGNILVETANQPLAPCVIVIGEVVKLRSLLQPKVVRNIAAEPLRDIARNQRMRESRTPTNPTVRQPARDLRPALRLEPLEDRQPSYSVPPVVEELPIIPPVSAEPLPLANQTVLVTRAVSQSNQFTQLLEDQGAAVIEMPTLEIGAPSSWRDLDTAIARLDEFDWLILTSTNGVDAFFKRLKTQTGDDSLSCNIKIAVVGEKTAQRLQQLGIPADFIPPKFVADSLAANFPEPLSGLRILFPRVESGGRELLVKEFANQGAKVREVAAYESRCPAAIAPQALQALRSRSIDIITFASSKTVQHFCQLLQQADDNWQSYLENVCIASIGPQTSESCQSLLGRVDAEATEFTLDGLTAAIVQWVASKEEKELAIAEPTPQVEIQQPEDTVESEPVQIFEALKTVNLSQFENSQGNNPTEESPTEESPTEEIAVEEIAVEEFISEPIQPEPNILQSVQTPDIQLETSQPETGLQEKIFTEAIAPDIAAAPPPQLGSLETIPESLTSEAPESEILQPEILDIRKPSQRKIEVERPVIPEAIDLEIKDAEVIAVNKSRVKNLKIPRSAFKPQSQDNE